MDWGNKLKNTDFIDVRNQFANMYSIAREEAAKNNQEVYIPNELANVLYPFMNNPCLETAIPLLEKYPDYISRFLDGNNGTLDNNETRLSNSAKDLVPWLYENIDTLSIYLQKQVRIDDDLNQNEAIYFETLFFALNVLDSLVFQFLGDNKRNIFMDSIFQTICDGLSIANKLSEIDFISGLNKSQDEYGKFKLLCPEKDSKTLKDTFCWEFAKKIVTEHGDGNPASITMIHLRALNLIINLQDALELVRQDNLQD